MKKLKVLWYSDSPCVETGFAQVAKQVLKTLHATGKYEFIINGINHYATWYDQEKYPYKIHSGVVMGDPLGKRLLIEMLKGEDFDILFTFNDLGLINQFVPAIKQIRGIKKFIWINYSPIDIDYMDRRHLSAFVECDIPVTYTKFAYNTCVAINAKLENKLQIIGHGTEPKLFHPMKVTKKNKVKKEGLDVSSDTFVVGVVNRNQWRKDLMRLMKGFKIFKDKYIINGKSVLYVHAKLQDDGGNLQIQGHCVGLEPAKDYMVADFMSEGLGIPRNEMNRVYNACDVIASTTLGEGWGLSTTEAFSAGVPVVMPRNTSLIELCGENEERGYLVDSGKFESDYACIYGKQNWLRPLTDLNDFADKLGAVYKDWLKARKTKNPLEREKIETYKKVRNALDWSNANAWGVVNHKWVELFEKAEKKLKKLRK